MNFNKFVNGVYFICYVKMIKLFRFHLYFANIKYVLKTVTLFLDVRFLLDGNTNKVY